MNKQKLRELCEAIVNGGNPDDVLAAGLEFMQEIDPEKTLALLDENAALLEALKDAATSLETIHMRSFGDDSNLSHPEQMRGYAGSRANVCRAAIAKYSES